MTEFRNIPGFPGYRISDEGSVWSCRQWGFGYGKTRPWTKIKARPNKYGYIVVTLCRNKHGYTRRISRLVLEAFVGPCPVGMQACHFPDDSKSNNSLSNLRWGTPVQNAADRTIHGKTCRGERSPLAKLASDEALAIRELCAAKFARKQIARWFGITVRAVYKIRSREVWSHLP